MKELQKYICHKQVHAMPMTRGDYNQYRGLQIPANEDPTDNGYLVIYGRGTPDHYESWSPQKQFIDGYRPYANSVTPDRINELMEQVEYRFERVGNTTVTACWAFLPNGFQLGYGQSACVDPNKFDQADGERWALERCQQATRNKLWELEGYRLAQELNPV